MKQGAEFVWFWLEAFVHNLIHSKISIALMSTFSNLRYISKWWSENLWRTSECPHKKTCFHWQTVTWRAQFKEYCGYTRAVADVAFGLGPWSSPSSTLWVDQYRSGLWSSSSDFSLSSSFIGCDFLPQFRNRLCNRIFPVSYFWRYLSGEKFLCGWDLFAF